MFYPSFRGMLLALLTTLWLISALSGSAQAAADVKHPAKAAAKSHAKKVAKQAEVKPPEPEKLISENVLNRTLLDLGFKDGMHFDASQISPSQDIYFRSPLDGAMSNGLLHIVYGASRYLTNASTFRVSVNDQSRELRNLGGDLQGKQEFDVPLTQQDVNLNTGFIKITLTAVLAADKKHCPDQGSDCAYVRVYPESGMHSTVRFEGGMSVRSAWSMISKQVKISLTAGDLTPEMFTAAWALHDDLVRTGSEVSFVRLPEIGDVVLAPIEELRAALTQRDLPDLAKNLKVDVNSGSAVFSIGTSYIVALTEPFNVSNFFLLSGLEGGKRAMPVQGLADDSAKEEPRKELNLAGLGLDNKPRNLSATEHETEWKFGFHSDVLPFGYLPDRMELGVLVPPMKSGNSVMFYVYMNNILQSATRVDSNGKYRQISVPLAKGDLAMYNGFRFVAQLVDGDDAGTSQVPIQLYTNSLLVVHREYIKKPLNFHELGLYFYDGFDTYLPKDTLKTPENLISFLSHFAVEQNFPLSYTRFFFYEPGAKLVPTKPFLLVGRDNTTDLTYTPVHFDRGGYSVVDRDGNKLLDITETKNLGVAQIVQAGDVSGLKVDVGASCSRVASDKPMRLRRDDVALLDRKGVLLTFDSRDPTGTKMAYTDYRDWLTILSENRFTVLIVVWILMTMFVVYTFIQVRRHSRIGK